MSANTNAAAYNIWGVDNVVYGPVDQPTLISWVQDERVTPETWIYQSHHDLWTKAQAIPELGGLFATPATIPTLDGKALKPGMLRRVKILADLPDFQLGRFLEFMEVLSIPQHTHLVRQGAPGNAMYLVLEGVLRVRLLIDDKETILATLEAGECFGEMSIFDNAPRSADVLANVNSVLLKITDEAFKKLVVAAPELAAPVLFALGKMHAARIRADNKHIRESVQRSRSGGY